MSKQNDRIYRFDSVEAYDACGIASLHLNPNSSGYGNGHRGEAGRVEVFWALIPSSGQWLFFEIGPAEDCLHEQPWHLELRNYAWIATGSGSGYFSLYIPREVVDNLKNVSELADDDQHMVIPFLEHLEKGTQASPRSS